MIYGSVGALRRSFFPLQFPNPVIPRIALPRFREKCVSGSHQPDNNAPPTFVIPAGCPAQAGRMAGTHVPATSWVPGLRPACAGRPPGMTVEGVLKRRAYRFGSVWKKSRPVCQAFSQRLPNHRIQTRIFCDNCDW